MSDLNLSKHSQKRIRGRVGIPKNGVEKHAEKAFEDGLKHSETSGRLCKYITKLYLTYGTANNIRVYHHYVYLFRGKTLITVLPLPQNLCKLSDDQAKSRSMHCEMLLAI